jgi:hypothetical protein
VTIANGLCIAGTGATGLDPQCLAMDGCMMLAMMLPATLPLWRATGSGGAIPTSLKPIAGYLVPWLIGLVALVSAQAALVSYRPPAALTWAFLAVGVLLCLLPWSASARESLRAQPTVDFRDGAKRGCGCLGANFGAILAMAVLDMSLLAFIVMAGSMAASQVAPRKFSGPLMALSLTAGFVLSAIASPI